MTSAKIAEHENIKSRELPPSAAVVCESIAATVLMCYKIDSKSAIGPLSRHIHDHTVYEVFIMEEGTAQLNIADKPLPLAKNDIVMIAPRTPHMLHSASGDLQRFCIRFKLEAESERVVKFGAPYCHGKLADNELRFIFEAVSELRNIANASPSKLTAYRERALLGVVFSYILERFARFDVQPPIESDNQLELYTKIENYLHYNYDQPITLDSLAAYLSYSRTQMRRIMEDCYGMPFTEKLREIRLNAARRQLVEGSATIDEIAAKCGYETRQGFESMFLKFVGITPNQYRKQNRPQQCYEC